jgi:hypothetical protein
MVETSNGRNALAQCLNCSRQTDDTFCDDCWGDDQ